jgi:hypothetical protein
MIAAAKRLPLKQRLSVYEYRLMASQLDLTKPIVEDVFLRVKSKPSGGFRRYCEFGILHRTAQNIVADMLRPQFSPAEFQYDAPGRGVSSAVKAARTLINGGHTYGRHLDIKSFFDKISHSFIEGPALKLEHGIKSAVLTGKHLSLVKAYPGNVDHLSVYTSEIASAGIPQGSATSPLVASILLSKLDLSNLPKGTTVLNYADDFLLMANEEHKLEAGSDALQAALTALSAGDLLLVEKSTQTSPGSFIYLGHRFEILPTGEVSVTVSNSSLNAFNTSVSQKAETLKAEAKQLVKLTGIELSSPIHHAELERMASRLAVWIKSWLAAFSEADNIGDLEEDFFADVVVICEDVGLTNAEEIWASAKATVALTYDEIIAS